MGEQIARQIVLGKRPDGLPDTLTIKLPDGTDGLLPVTFKYRTRTEFGEFLDSIFGGPAPEFDGTGAKAAENQQRGTTQYNGQYIFGCLKDWGLDAPFTLQSCIQLADELPGVTQAIMNRYRQLTTEGRLGN